MKPVRKAHTKKRVRVTKSGVIRPPGPYSKEVVLGKLDRRTREGKALATFRDELTEHVGTPTAPQKRLIDMAANLQLRVALMDDRLGQTGTVTEVESRMYLSWVNALGRLLVAIGAPASASQPAALSLADYLASPEAAGVTIDADQDDDE
jgi:hypothetical protein